MSKIYMLTYKNEAREDVIERIFPTESEALEYVKAEKVLVTVGHHEYYVHATLPRSYRIVSYVIKSEDIVVAPIVPVRQRVETTPILSFTDPSKTYYVSSVDKKATACTCPRFENRGRRCKHMNYMDRAWIREGNA